MTIDLSDFDRFFATQGYKRGEEPQAFAAWLASRTGKPVDGIATDLSAAVHGEPKDAKGRRMNWCK